MFPKNVLWIKDGQGHISVQTRQLDQTFKGYSGVIGISADIVVFRRKEEEHDRNMHLMMKRCQSTGLKLNPEKNVESSSMK